MGEYTYSITDNTERRSESDDKVAKFSKWYDSTEPENRLNEAIELGYIEAKNSDDILFLETVLDEARRMNHGSEWIKEIMDREREFDNPHLTTLEEAEAGGYTVEDIVEAYKMDIAIKDWAISANKKSSQRT